MSQKVTRNSCFNNNSDNSSVDQQDVESSVSDLDDLFATDDHLMNSREIPFGQKEQKILNKNVAYESE